MSDHEPREMVAIDVEALLFGGTVKRAKPAKRPQMWNCNNGAVIGYDPHKLPNGKWSVAVYKPEKDNPAHFVRVYYREFAMRKTAKKRAVHLYAQNQGKAWRAKNAWWLESEWGVKPDKDTK